MESGDNLLMNNVSQRAMAIEKESEFGRTSHLSFLTLLLLSRFNCLELLLSVCLSVCLCLSL